jgi:hypothetical protein
MDIALNVPDSNCFAYRRSMEGNLLLSIRVYGFEFLSPVRRRVAQAGQG